MEIGLDKNAMDIVNSFVNEGMPEVVAIVYLMTMNDIELVELEDMEEIEENKEDEQNGS